MLSGLFVIGIAALAVSYIWQLDFLYNKKIWSSFYTLLTTGLAIMILDVLIWFIEILDVRNGLMRFFDVFGKNPLFIYVISGIVPRVLGLVRIDGGVDDKGKIKYLSPMGWFYNKVCAKLTTVPELSSFYICRVISGCLLAIGLLVG